MELKDELLAAALRYVEQGFSIIPLGLDEEKKHHKKPLVTWTLYQKKPPTKEEVIEWWKTRDVKGIAMIVEGTDFVIIDVEQAGLSSIEDLHLPQTVCSRTGGGGRHIIFRCNDIFADKIRFRPNMDARRKGLIILPPSLHYSGKRYEWEIPFGGCEIAELPAALLKELMNSQKPTDKHSLNFTEGSRDNTLISLAGSLHHRGLEEETIYAALQAVNAKECKPPLPDKDLVKIAKSATRYEVGASRGSRTPVLVRLEDVQREEVRWRWPLRIPIGKLTMVEGDPGVGKSYFTLEVAAAITTGRPLYGDETHYEPGKVLLLSAEDGLADTIRPRLEDMGADITKVRSLAAVRDQKGNELHFSLDKDLEAVASVLDEGDYTYVVIDPLNAYMGGTDTNKDSSVRTILTPLSKMAEKYKVALICVRHLNKAKGTNALSRSQGSVGFWGAARVVHLIGMHPTNLSERVIICTKNNLVEKPPALSYAIEGGRVVWKGETTVSQFEVLGDSHNGYAATYLEQAERFLSNLLMNGEMPQKEIEEKARDEEISLRTLRRAKKDLQIESKKVGNCWYWKLANSLDVDPWPTSIPGLLDNDNWKIAKESVDILSQTNAAQIEAEPAQPATDDIEEEEYDEYEAAGVTEEGAKVAQELSQEEDKEDSDTSKQL